MKVIVQDPRVRNQDANTPLVLAQHNPDSSRIRTPIAETKNVLELVF